MLTQQQELLIKEHLPIAMTIVILQDVLLLLWHKLLHI